jgi:hypothetical protein
MDAQELRSLQEAYNQVHQVDENLLRSLDTGARNLAGTIGGNIGAKKGREKMGNLPVLGDIGANQGRTQGTQRGQQMYDKAKETVGGLLKQDYEYDMFDVILEYLVAEGYADTQEAAQAIMVNMGEEWRESICEELTGERKKRALEKGGYLANRVASGKEGQPLERINRSGDVTMRTTKKGPTKRGGMGFKGKTKSDWYGTDDAHGYANKSRRRRGIEVKDTSDDL